MRNKALETAGSSSFMGPKRVGSLANKVLDELPGPGDYLVE
jgi:hypothetical protein